VPANNGSAGRGGSGVLDTSNAFSAAGGGGGWFGGGGGVSGAGGGGGSSHIQNLTSGFGISSRTIDGNQSMPATTGAGEITGNAGNGFARITFISSEVSMRRVSSRS